MPSASATLQQVDLMFHDELAANSVNPYSTAQFKKSDNKHNKYIDPIGFAKRRKPPEYVGYAVNVNQNVDAQRQSVKLKELLANATGSVSETGDKTNVFKLPVPDELYSYGWKADGQVWEAECRELNCARGSVCVPDTLRGRRPRCQCPLGTDGPRCERRTSTCNLLVIRYR